MKNPYSLRPVPAWLLSAAALTGSAAAHPGHHGTSSDPSGSVSGLLHFLTSIDHVGPVLAGLLLLYALRRRAALSAAVSGWRIRNRDKRSADRQD
ncbi:MAG TPA: hypothetical protein VLO11_02790 [Luteolibacter sp.]|nr:hypothetical protein [Luteolibacter sp.]